MIYDNRQKRFNGRGFHFPYAQCSPNRRNVMPAAPKPERADTSDQVHTSEKEILSDPAEIKEEESSSSVQDASFIAPDDQSAGEDILARNQLNEEGTAAGNEISEEGTAAGNGINEEGTAAGNGNYEGEPAAGNGNYEGKPAAGNGNYEGEPAAGNGNYVGEPAAGNGNYEGEPAAGNGNYEGGPAAGNGNYEEEPAAGNENYEEEPAAGNGNCEGEPAAGNGNCEGDSAAGNGNYEGNPSAGNGNYEGNPSAGNGNYEEGSAAGNGNCEGEPAAGNGNCEGDSAAGNGNYEERSAAGNGNYEEGAAAGNGNYEGDPTAGNGNCEGDPAAWDGIYEEDPVAGNRNYEEDTMPANGMNQENPAVRREIKEKDIFNLKELGGKDSTDQQGTDGEDVMNAACLPKTKNESAADESAETIKPGLVYKHHEESVVRPIRPLASDVLMPGSGENRTAAETDSTENDFSKVIKKENQVEVLPVSMVQPDEIKADPAAAFPSNPGVPAAEESIKVHSKGYAEDQNDALTTVESFDEKLCETSMPKAGEPLSAAESGTAADKERNIKKVGSDAVLTAANTECHQGETKVPDLQAVQVNIDTDTAKDIQGACTRNTSKKHFEALQSLYREEQSSMDGLHGRGLFQFKQWWYRNRVEIKVNGEKICGVPIITDQNTLRVVNEKHSYFIPVEKIDYIRTSDGLDF